MRASPACVLVLLLLTPLPAYAATAIGTVDRVQGSARGSVEGSVSDLAVGGAVYLDEVISTGADARVAITLEDGTALTVGENAELTLDEFVYQPAGESVLTANVVGAFRYVSGKLAPGASRYATVTTPFATIGIRGTDFWGGQSDGVFGVVVLEGAVTVTTASGSAVLDAANMGVDIDNGVAAAPRQWGEPRRQRALATVSFR